MAQVQFFPINTPLINYFFYPAPLTQGGPNVPLAGGTLNFYDDTDHSLQLPTYSDVSDPNNPVVNPNPIVLGQAGDCPPFYLANQLYFIQIKDSSGNVISTVSHYDPANNTGSITPSSFNGNLIANGQFTYPINFSFTNETPGLATGSTTDIAWGWVFLQDEDTTTENTITFVNVFDEQLEGAPINQVQLLSTNVDINEGQKDFVAAIGNVNYLAGQDVTFSGQFISLLNFTSNVSIIIEKNYGINGSPTEFLTVDTFSVGTEQLKVVNVFEIPSNTGKTIGLDSYTAIHIQIGLGQIVNVGMTNILLLPGNISNPVYQAQSFNEDVSQILGSSFDVTDAGLPQNYSNYMYADAEIFPYADTGTIVLCPIGSSQPFRVPCDGASYNVEDYNATGIPYNRLYNVIGNDFGSSASLSVTASSNAIIFTSLGGARAHSAYTDGAAPTGFSFFNNVLGLNLDVSATISGINTVDCVFVGYTPATAQNASNPIYLPKPASGYIGNWFASSGSTAIMTTTITTSPPTTRITFNSNNMSDYRTGQATTISPPGINYTGRFLEWGTASNNTHGNFPNFVAGCIFLVNGTSANPSSVQGPQFVPIFFQTTNTLQQNMANFVAAVSNPFIWTVAINVAPPASSYFLYSSSTTDYYAWYKVNGSGTDPAVAGRTGFEVDISSADSSIIVAEKTAAAINNSLFNVPDSTYLPTIPSKSSTLLNWYINL